jgi:hypothetical protein
LYQKYRVRLTVAHGLLVMDFIVLAFILLGSVVIAGMFFRVPIAWENDDLDSRPAMPARDGTGRWAHELVPSAWGQLTSLRLPPGRR